MTLTYCYIFGKFSHQLVYVSAVPNGLVSVVLAHDGLPLELPGELVVAAADQKVNLALGEDGLALQKLAGVAGMEHVVDAVGVYADLKQQESRQSFLLLLDQKHNIH